MVNSAENNEPTFCISDGDDERNPITHTSTTNASSSITTTVSQLINSLKKIQHLMIAVSIILVFLYIFAFEELGGVGFDLQTNAPGVFSWHPLLNVIVFGGIMSEGILIYRIFDARRETVKIAHMVLMCLSSFLAILSLTAVLRFHAAIGAPDFYSLHSWIGIVIYAMLWLQLLAGLTIYGIPSLVDPVYKARLMPFHRIFGIILYVGGLICINTGFLQKQRFIGGTPFQAVHMFTNFSVIWINFTGAIVLFEALNGGEIPKRSSSTHEAAVISTRLRS